MPIKTPLCDVLGIEVPIIQAPIGSATCPELAAAVSNAGGLGMLAMSFRSKEDVRQVIRETFALTRRPFGVNLVLEWDQTERLNICLEEGVRLVSFFWGDPSRYVQTVHDAGGLVLHTVGSAEEAKRAVSAGVDIIVAQGWEAGGHVWGQVASMPLIPRVVDAVTPVPVVAAGGIGDGRGIAAALTLGASGVWMGTRFLLSEEARAHDRYKDELARASESNTCYSTLFDIGWKEAPHRTLRNSTVRRWEDAGCPTSGYRPNEGEIIARTAYGAEIERYSDCIPLPGMTGELEALALYAGQSVGLVNQVKPAGEIVRDLLGEVEQTLHRVKSVFGRTL